MRNSKNEKFTDTVTEKQVAEAFTPKDAELTEEHVEKVFDTRGAALTQKIYVGPNLLGLPKYTVIETEFTEHIKKVIKECPDIGKLFVPIPDMAETEKRLKEKGTREHRYNQNIAHYKLNGKDE